MDFTEEADFPAVNQISFYKLFEALEEMTSDNDEHIANYASSLLKELKAYPELREGFQDLSLLEKYKEPISKLAKLIFPEALQDNEIKGVSAPFLFDPFITSRRFKKIIDNAGEEFRLSLLKLDEDLMYKVGCVVILGALYQFPVDVSRPFVVEIPDKVKNEKRFYRIAFNADMMEVVATEKAPKITAEDHKLLVDNFEDTALWKEKFPPGTYIMKGIGIMNMMDVTFDQNINFVTSNLLNPTPDSMEKIKENIRSIISIQDLKIGFVNLEDNKFKKPDHKDMDNFLLFDKDDIKPEDLLCIESQNKLLQDHEPFIISDTSEYLNKNDNLLGNHLKAQDISSYIIIPLQFDEKTMVLLEIASPRKYELNTVSVSRLEDLLPILSIAANRFKEEEKNKIEAIIQQECTSIHPSVKWRFEKEARKYIQDEFHGGHPQFHDIVFRDVYPLYGQTDIKGSSTRRNNAVIHDLVSQLNLVVDIMNKIMNIQHMPMFDELLFRIDSHIKDLEKGLNAGSEHEVMIFLEKEVYPVFEHTRSLHPDINVLVSEYEESLDDKLHIVYEARKQFDQSVTKANLMMAAFMDEKQIEAQKVFPHFFERYKTDGLEYNIYIGQSIVKEKKFDPLFLRNLQLWQLETMCQLENEFRLLQPDLATSLEVASLILVYSTPLSVHFRMDEKRFDVEGAYNARYEIVKKRVDKAHIKGTDERITVPGKIAIIYTNERDKEEYLKYIEYLESKGYIVPQSTEDHTLEDLQGITGLKALRVTLTYANDHQRSDQAAYNELLLEIESSH